MKMSRKKFVLTFLLSAFAFQFISNSILGNEARLFPRNGEWFQGTDSPISWKKNLATMLYPVKFVLIKPLSSLGEEEDPAPPVLLFAFALYWTALAVVLHYLFNTIFNRTKA
jgi:hypothetical protein